MPARRTDQSRTTRDRLLDAAADAIVGRGYRQLRMGDVAGAAGVSRQTVYNEFGDKWGLARALTLRETMFFLDGMDRAMSQHAEPADAIAAAAAYALNAVAGDPLVKAVLTGVGDEELLPLLTTQAEPVITASRGRIVAHAAHHWPHLDSAEVAIAAEAATRLILSHIVLPGGPPDEVAATLARLVERFLAPAAAAPPPDRRGPAQP